MVRFLSLFLFTAAIIGCSKNSSTGGASGDPKKEDEMIRSQPHTEEEARQAIKDFYVGYVMGKKEVDLVSLSKPIEPSSEYLAKFPGSTAYYVTVELREPKLTNKEHVLLTVRRGTIGANKGKLLLGGGPWSSEREIEQMMGQDWLRANPIPWQVPGKK